MTIEEAIEHCKEVALSNAACCAAYRKGGQTVLADECDACAAEHEQLAEWLTELKQHREAETIAQSKNNAYYIKSDSVRNLTDEEAETLNKMNYSGAISTGDSLFEEIGERPKTNTAKIAKLCNEIEDIACDISQQTMNDIVSAESRIIFDKAKEISAEITAPPKSNGDRIRQMMDEELAEWLDLHGECNQCAYHPAQCKTECNEGHLKWLRQEVSEDATERTD